MAANTGRGGGASPVYMADYEQDGYVPHWMHYAHNRPHHYRNRMYQVGLRYMRVMRCK